MNEKYVLILTNEDGGIAVEVLDRETLTSWKQSYGNDERRQRCNREASCALNPLLSTRRSSAANDLDRAGGTLVRRVWAGSAETRRATVARAIREATVQASGTMSKKEARE